MKAVFERCCDAGAVHIQVAHAFDDAARWFVKVSAHAVGCYDEPGLGEWSLRDLLRHTRRSLSTVETYLDVALTDSGPVQLADAVAFYQATADALDDSAAAVERHRQRGPFRPGRRSGQQRHRHQDPDARTIRWKAFAEAGPSRRSAPGLGRRVGR